MAEEEKKEKKAAPKKKAVAKDAIVVSAFFVSGIGRFKVGDTLPAATVKALEKYPQLKDKYK